MLLQFAHEDDCFCQTIIMSLEDAADLADRMMELVMAINARRIEDKRASDWTNVVNIRPN